jgi:putative peptidoglycan lipid II flippase
MPVSAQPPNEATPAEALAGSRLRSILRRWRGRWLRISSGSVNRQVFGTAMVVGLLTLGIKLVSLVKESVVAASFGTASALDAFIIALLLPTTITAILSGSLNAALIPTYIEVLETESAEAAQRLYTTILMWNTVLLVALTLVMAGTVGLWLPAIASGFDPAKQALTRTLLYGSLPMVVLTGFSTTWGAILNAGQRFAIVAVAPAMQPLGIILMLGLFCRSWGIYSLLAGTSLGILLEAVLVGMTLRRRGHPLAPHWHGVTAAFRKVRAQYGACIASAFMVSGMSLVDQAFASSLGPRSNSALAYGSKLVSLMLSLGATALATAILPQLSRMVALRNWPGIRHFLRFYSTMIMVVAIPAVVVLVLMSSFLVRLLYQHGAFTAADTSLVVRIQVLYLLRIPFSTTLVLVTRTLTALRANEILLYMSFGSFALNGLLDWAFIKPFGIAGITLSTSACSVVILLCLGTAMLRVLKKREAEFPT